MLLGFRYKVRVGVTKEGWVLGIEAIISVRRMVCVRLIPRGEFKTPKGSHSALSI
jgi:hypothetical protein